MGGKVNSTKTWATRSQAKSFMLWKGSTYIYQIHVLKTQSSFLQCSIDSRDWAYIRIKKLDGNLYSLVIYRPDFFKTGVWCIPAISTLRRLKWKDCEFEISLFILLELTMQNKFLLLEYTRKWSQIRKGDKGAKLKRVNWGWEPHMRQSTWR